MKTAPLHFGIAGDRRDSKLDQVWQCATKCPAYSTAHRGFPNQDPQTSLQERSPSEDQLWIETDQRLLFYLTSNHCEVLYLTLSHRETT